MALTQISTAGVKDDAVTAGKIPANAVGSSELADNAVDNAAVASNAAIAGTKISPDFGSQAVTTTGNASVGETLTVTGNNPNLVFTDSNSNPDFKIYGSNGAFSILDSTNAVNRFVISSSGGVTIGGNTDFGAGIDVTGVTTTTGRVNIGDTQMSSNLLNVEDGTAATIDLASHGSGGDTAYIGVKKSTGGGLTFGISNRDIIFKTGATYSNGTTFDSGTERMRIDSSGRLLLGTTTAGEATADDFTVATSGHTGISIRSGTSGEGNIFFADGTSGDAQYRGMVRYFHNDDALAFNAAGSERMRIDSSGNVGINTTSISNRLEIANSTSDKGILIKSTGNNYHTICGDANRSQATDNILRLDAKWNGTVVGRIRLIAGNDTTNKDDGIIAFDTASGGAMGERMRILSSGGLTFNGDTAAANALDDYEEGSFTPVLENDGSTSYHYQEGRYVKIGRLVHVNIFVKINNEDGGATSVTGIENMPFTNGASHVITFLITGNNGWDANLTSTNFAGWMNSGASTARFYKNSGGNLNAISVNDIGSEGEIAISVTYQT